MIKRSKNSMNQPITATVAPNNKNISPNENPSIVLSSSRINSTMQRRCFPFVTGNGERKRLDAIKEWGIESRRSK